MVVRGALLAMVLAFAASLCGDVMGCVWGRIIWEKDPRSDTPLFGFVVNRKAGYIDATGRVAIPAEFTADELNQGYDDFFEGVASTSRYEMKFIDSNGRPVQFGKYRVSGKSHFSEGLIPAEVSEQPKKYGFIDHEAMLAFAALFDEADGFAEGLAPVRIGDKWGYVNRSGAQVIPARFLMALQSSEGVARVIEEGPCRYDNNRCDQRVLGLTDALTSARKYPACRYTFIGKTGRRLGSGRFVEASDFKEGLAAVSDGKRWGFIDMSSVVRIPLQFESVGSFSEGLATFREDKKWGFIDTEGKVVIEARYDFARQFRSGAAVVSDGKRSWFIDRAGKRLFARDFVNASSFALGLAHVDFGTEFGYIDRSGKVVFQYPHAVSKQ